MQFRQVRYWFSRVQPGQLSLAGAFTTLGIAGFFLLTSPLVNNEGNWERITYGVWTTWAFIGLSGLILAIIGGSQTTFWKKERI